MKDNPFNWLLFTEAEGDEDGAPPDIGSGGDTAGDYPGTTDPGGPPDIDTPDGTPDIGGDEPPELEGFGDMPGYSDDPGAGEQQDENPPVLGEKISLIMNKNLYQRFLTLLNTVDNQIDSIRSNSEIIYSVSPEALETTKPLCKLAENIRLYLTNHFLDNNYSKNLLFYNMCLNQMKLLDDIFFRELRRGKQLAR